MKRLLSSFIFLPVFLFSLSTTDLNQEARSGWLALTKEQTIGQSFKASEDNLSGIKLFTRNPNLANHEPIIFHLKDSPSASNDILSVVFSGANVGWDYSLRIQFAPIADSKGKTFYFFLESPTTEAGQAIEFGYNKDDNYKFGEAYVATKPMTGDLFFVTFYKISPQNFISSTIDSLFQRAGKDQKFFIVYFVIFLALVIGLVKNNP